MTSETSNHRTSEVENDNKIAIPTTGINSDQLDNDFEAFLNTVGLGKWQTSIFLINFFCK